MNRNAIGERILETPLTTLCKVSRKNWRYMGARASCLRGNGWRADGEMEEERKLSEENRMTVG